MHVVNTEAVSYQSKTPEKCLETAERKKKMNKKYPNTYPNKRQHFTPFFFLMYGILGVEAEATLKHIAIHLVQEWKNQYSRTCG